VLAKLAFGQTVPESQIPCKGISKLQLTDIDYACSINSTIKLIGSASCSDGKLSVSVTPMVVPNSHMLATIGGAGNAVAVNSENMGLTSYVGPGAGRFPTANSVVADILRVVAGRAQAPLCPKQTDSLVLDNDYNASFYIRIPTAESIVRQVAEMADAYGVVINSLSLAGSSVVVITAACQLSEIEALCRGLIQVKACEADPVFMPVMA
jgi:homoserine dehydrogenase